MDSIFREKKLQNDELGFRKKTFHKDVNVNIVTHDNGILRARTYSLSSKIEFTIYSGSTIKELIEKDFDYFTWLPRNIEDFRYTEEVLVYAEECLDLMEKIENYPETLRTDLGKTIYQVDAMLSYEHCLDFEDDPNLLNYYKSEVNVAYYRMIINTPNERLIRQVRDLEGNSFFYKRKYFQEVRKIHA